MKRNLHREVADAILAEMKGGAAPWVKPWRSMGVSGSSAIPHNAVTGRPYSGSNIFLLWIKTASAGYASPAYLTFKQAQDAGGTVRKGEKGTMIVFVSFLDKEDAQGREKKVAFLKSYTVFNIEQCDGLRLPAQTKSARAPVNPDVRHAEADEFITATLADIREGGSEACYSPARDVISLPPFAAFKNADNYYATAFHELAHWTGHEKRLARLSKLTRFGSAAYAAEELVAELTAALLCAEFGFNSELRHAGYLANWIKLLEDHDAAFFTAASAASKALDHMRGLALREPLALAA